jgi:hypothetical protein
LAWIIIRGFPWKNITENIIFHDVREGKSLVRRWNEHRYNDRDEWAYLWWCITWSQRMTLPTNHHGHHVYK